ncbi:aspartate dehydrogenase [Sodalis sp. dw_96]|uniref:aspartate dehydrogenase n=1 Tax=Sodalis sp. dw_96 TaxID=2719794 RepID=UPI001BD396D4|nr:aspartate dehydrogenase [Sodalis sp. dw_96]
MQKTLRVGIAGFGSLGRGVAKALDQGKAGYTLAAIAVRDPLSPPAVRWQSAEPLFTNIAGLAPLCDLIIECAPSSLLESIAAPALRLGKTVVVLSSTGLLALPGLQDIARENGGKIIVPSGGIAGLDALAAAAVGELYSVKMVTRKPPKSLAGAPYLVDNAIDVDAMTEPTRIFKGSPREAARLFPANANVLASVALAGMGPDRTEYEIWAVPGLQYNTHTVAVDSSASRFTLNIENVPSADNPRTGILTLYSVLAVLDRLNAPVRIGT